MMKKNIELTYDDLKLLDNALHVQLIKQREDISLLKPLGIDVSWREDDLVKLESLCDKVFKLCCDAYSKNSI